MKGMESKERKAMKSSALGANSRAGRPNMGARFLLEKEEVRKAESRQKSASDRGRGTRERRVKRPRLKMEAMGKERSWIGVVFVFRKKCHRLGRTGGGNAAGGLLVYGIGRFLVQSTTEEGSRHLLGSIIGTMVGV